MDRRTIKRTLVALALALAACGAGSPLQAQDLLANALTWFPPKTIALEYSRPSALRSLPEYETLRGRYLGRNLQQLETSLAKIGIHEDDIDEMALGWQTGGKTDMVYEGLASGRFDAAGVAKKAAAAGIAGRPLGDLKAYCFPNSICVAMIDSSLGAFGPLPVLKAMEQARAGDASGASSNTQFADLVNSAQSDAPIWGVALGTAVSTWFKAWMPGEKNLQMDWASAFKNVSTLSYKIEASDTVQLDVQMECATMQAASSVRQLLEGLRLLQQLAWQTNNPTQPNPFQNLEVEGTDRQVSFELTADYAALEHIGPLGKPQD